MATSPETPKDPVGDTADELVRTRAELDALRTRFRSIIQRVADGIVVVDREGTVQFANSAAEAIFDRSAEALVGSPFGHALVSGETTEIDIVRRDQPVTAELRVMDTEWEGEPARIVSLRDITDRKEAEERERRLLREQVARAEAEDAARRAEFLAEAGRRLSASLDLHATLQDAADLIVEEFADYCALDLVEGGETERYAAAREDHHLDALLREAERYPLRVDADDPLGRAYRECGATLVEPVTEQWLRSAARDDAHFELLSSLGPRSIVVAPLFTGQECLGLLTAACTRSDQPFDEADLHLADELGQRAALAIENARLFQDAEAANRAKTNFLSVMSHELRTPLSAIIGYADLIDRGVAGETNEKQKHFLGRIRTSSNHLLQIIEEILAFASAETGESEVELGETTLGTLADSVAAVAEPLARDTDLEFEIYVEQPDAKLRTDARKARQILLNLVSNAVKFTREGSVRLAVRVDDDAAVFAVHDTGPGIPNDQLEDVFDRFRQLEDPMTRTSGGTGLGLTIARSFARALGGTLDVESTRGVGSTFTLRLPRNLQA